MEHFLLFFLLICGFVVLISPFCKNSRRFVSDPSDENEY